MNRRKFIWTTPVIASVVLPGHASTTLEPPVTTPPPRERFLTDITLITGSLDIAISGGLYTDIVNDVFVTEFVADTQINPGSGYTYDGSEIILYLNGREVKRGLIPEIPVDGTTTDVIDLENGWRKLCYIYWVVEGGSFNVVMRYIGEPLD